MNAHVETLRELLRTGDLSDWHSLDPALQAAIAALEAQGEVVAWQRRVRISVDKWGEWTEYTDMFDEGRPDKIGRFNCEYRALYIAPPSFPAMRAVVEALKLADQFFDGDDSHWEWDNGESFPASKIRSAYTEVKKLMEEWK